MDTNDCLFEEIDFFTELFLFIDNILYLNSPSTLIKHIDEFVNILKNKEEKIKSKVEYYIKKALSESIYYESSLAFRYILINVYNVDYSNIPDWKIFGSVFDKMEDLKLKYFIDDDKNELNLMNIFKNEKEKTIKLKGDFFDNFEMTYEFDKEHAKKFFDSLINKNYKLTKLNLILLPFSHYEELFNNIYDSILKDDEIFLSLPERLYLGIISSCSVGCDYLTKDLIEQFLINGGKKEWIINGLNEAPEEFKLISKISNILNNQPWIILNQNFLNESEFSTKIEKFVQYCIIIIYFGRLANIITSFKFLIQSPEDIINNSNNINNSKITKDKSNEMSKIYKELEKIENSKEKRKKQSEFNYSYIKEKNSKNYQKKINNPIYKKFTNDFCTEYQDFDYHTYEFFSNYDYDFETVVFYQLQEYWPKIMNLIKDDYLFIYEMTSYCIGNKEKIRSVEYFRKAIVFYVEQLFGFINETYDYSKTNELLIISLKDSIKNSVCYPQQINFDLVYSNEYNIPDLIHTILLSTCSKVKVQLSYLAILLTNYKKERS